MCSTYSHERYGSFAFQYPANRVEEALTHTAVCILIAQPTAFQEFPPFIHSNDKSRTLFCADMYQIQQFYTICNNSVNRQRSTLHDPEFRKSRVALELGITDMRRGGYKWVRAPQYHVLVVVPTPAWGRPK